MFKDSHMTKSYFKLPSLFSSVFNGTHKMVPGFYVQSPFPKRVCYAVFMRN